MHAGIAIGMGLMSFSAVMIALNVGAFLISPVPQSQAESSETADSVHADAPSGLVQPAL